MTNFKTPWRVHLLLLSVAAASFLLVSQFEHSTVLQLLGGTPGVLALFGILYQLLRDDAAHRGAISRQRDQQLFDLSATSHMAKVAFDKHVAFCEEYASEMYATVSTLFREGPTEKALSHSGNLFRLRQKHSVWLTPEIEAHLEPFELALRRIGANAHLYSTSPSIANESGKVKEMYAVFSSVMELEMQNVQVVDKQVAVSTIMQRLRAVLGIEALSKMRSDLLNVPRGA